MTRKLLVLAGLVVLLWGAWYAFHIEEKTELSIHERRDFFRADSLTTDSIAVRYGNWTNIVRRNDTWIVKFTDWETEADPSILGQVFRFTNDMVLENLISTREEKHRSFKVDTLGGTLLQFFSAGAPKAEFVMGKAGADMNHTYIRQLQSDSVYLARGDFQRVFRRVPMDWGTRIVIPTDTASIASIRWITRDDEVRVARADGGPWLVYKNGEMNGLPVDTAVFNPQLRTLCPTRIDAYGSDGTGIVAQTDAPFFQLIVDSRSGRSDTLLWNEPLEQENRMFAFRPGRPKPLYIFHKGTFDRMRSTYKDLVAKDTK